MDSTNYEAWYHTPRGTWIGDTEFHLLMTMLKPAQGSTLLDVGCGTGYFSRRFASNKLDVIALDPDESMLSYARTQNEKLGYIRGNALNLPFADNSIDFCTAVTSLCFVNEPKQAIHEILRVTRYSTVIGFLNRHSRLYKQKHDQGAYRGARWDAIEDISDWMSELPQNINVEYGSAVFFPIGNMFARTAEVFLPHQLHWGSLLVVAMHHSI